MTLDYLFGGGVSASLPRERLRYEFSRRTGRMKRVYLDERLLGTLRSDGGVALTVAGAAVLLQSGEFRRNCVVVQEGVEEFVAEGKSVFCKHVVECGDNIRPASDVAVLDVRGNVVAVGKAVLSAKMMRAFKTGVAVKVRQGSRKAGKNGSVQSSGLM